MLRGPGMSGSSGLGLTSGCRIQFSRAVILNVRPTLRKQKLLILVAGAPTAIFVADHDVGRPMPQSLPPHLGPGVAVRGWHVILVDGADALSGIRRGVCRKGPG